MPSKTITQLTALDTVSTNLANTLFVVYDTETGTTKKASLSQIDTAVERSIQNVTSAGIYANAAFASANTKLSANGGTITGNLIVTNTITSSNIISSNTITSNNLTVTGIFTVDGVVLQWHTPIPLTSKGDPGDQAGFIAIDDDKLYRCVENYTNGANNIWVFVNFTGGTWG
jgi:hypothetical protein